MSASFMRLKDGSWGVRVQGAATVGQTVTVTKKDGSTDMKTVTAVIWTGNGISLCRISDGGGSGGSRKSRSDKLECGRCGRMSHNVRCDHCGYDISHDF